MRKAQLIILWVGIGLVLLTGLFPAWGRHTRSGAFEVVAYGFLLNPPHPNLAIDYGQMLLLWVMIGIVTGGLIWSLSLLAKSAGSIRADPAPQPAPAGHTQSPAGRSPQTMPSAERQEEAAVAPAASPAQTAPPPAMAATPASPRPKPDPFPWRRPAYALYCWYLWIWLILPFNLLVAATLGMEAADASPGLVRDWMVVNAVTVAAILVALLYAQLVFLRQMARSMGLFVGCFTGVALLGALNLMIAAGTTDTALRETATPNGLAQLAAGGMLGLIAFSLNTQRHQRFFQVYEVAKRQNAQRSGHARVGRLRLLRGIATGRYGARPATQGNSAGS